MVVEVNRAVAVAMCRGAHAGLELLLRLEDQAGLLPRTRRAPIYCAGRTSVRLPLMPTSERSTCAPTAPSAPIFGGGLANCSMRGSDN